MVSYTALFALMLLWVASIPLFGDTAVGRTLLALVYLGMMSVALTISLPPRWPRWWPLLALAIVLLPRIALSQEPTWLATAFELGGVLVAIVIPILLTAHVLGTADVTANTIFGALSAYVFLGFGWTQIYLAIDAFMPGSFSFPTEGPHSAFEYLDTRRRCVGLRWES